ncbi:Dolichol phosphate-mannose biosynthesis regulatory protein [Rhodotorula toruloides]
MTFSDRTVGGIGLLCSISFFLYYTLWTLLSPFLPPSSPLLILFPLSREWAIRLPALILLFGLCFVGMVTGFVLIETARKKERERQLRRGGRKFRPTLSKAPNSAAEAPKRNRSLLTTPPAKRSEAAKGAQREEQSPGEM